MKTYHAVKVAQCLDHEGKPRDCSVWATLEGKSKRKNNLESFIDAVTYSVITFVGLYLVGHLMAALHKGTL